ncbi:MAG: hypothetical protein Q7I94_05405, partial [Candidatus Contubernalis sp.]|nr:hypothetical protein [Candidatus Contubernalis sp.]
MKQTKKIFLNLSLVWLVTSLFVLTNLTSFASAANEKTLKFTFSLNDLTITKVDEFYKIGLK